MREITISCKTVTPLLSRGIIPNGNVYPFELRPQSIKGVLHFWFRSIIPFVIDESDLKKIKEVEQAIFGSTKQKSPFGVDLNIIEARFENIASLINKPVNKSYKYALKYCAYGTMGEADNHSYTCLDANSRFEIKYRLSKRISSTYDAFLISLTKLVSFYGGFGAKSRKGFGSFEIVDILKPEQKTSTDLEDLLTNSSRGSISLAELKKQRNKQPDKTTDPISPCVSDMSKLLDELNIDHLPVRERGNNLEAQAFPMLLFSRDMEIVEGQSRWQDVLKRLFQPRGRDGMGQGIYTRIKLNKLRGFKTNSDVLQTMRKTVMLGKPLPEGTVFKPSILGLPIQYQKVNKNPKDTGDEKLAVDAIENAGDKEAKKRRKASPLFISVHKEDDNNYFARALLMPSKIIDPNTSLLLTYEDKSYALVEYENFGELWNLLEGVIE